MVDIEDSEGSQSNPYCVCGRLAAKIHCPVCGAADVRAKGQKHWERHTRQVNGVLTHVTVPVYGCRRCAALFTDEQWRLHCRAPLASMSNRRPRAGDVALTPDQILTEDDKAKIKPGDISEMFGPEAQKVLEKYLK